MQAILLTVSLVLWVAVGFCAPSAARGRRRSLFWLLIALATTLTLQPDLVYYRVDPVLGGVHATYFLFHATAIVAVALLSNLVQEAVSPRGLTRRRRLATTLIAGSIIVLQAILFFGGDWHLTDDIRQPFLARWDYALYASTTWLAMGYFAVAVASACLLDRRTQRRTITRVSLGLVALGCFWVLTYAVISLSSAAASVALQGFTFQGWPFYLYHLAILAAPICLAVGLGLTATVDAVQASRRWLRDRVLLWRISPLWTRLLANAPELSIERPLSRSGLLLVRQPGAHLYRRYVEVRDSLLIDPGQSLSSAERMLIDRVEDHVRTTPPALLTARPSTATPASARSETLDRTRNRD